MEFLDGKPLDELIRQHGSVGLPKNDVKRILSDICAALIYAHEKGIIHSDFKPGNIFVTKEGVTKVFDFGIAREVGKADKPGSNGADKVIGDLGALTVAYAAVEMFECKEPDVRDDIYALGCIAYEMYTGKHPFNRVGADEAKKRNLKPEKITGIHKNQWLAIEKALAFDREDRIATVGEFWSLFNKKSSPIVIFSSLALVVFSVIAAVVYQYVPDQSAIKNAEIAAIKATKQVQNEKQARFDDLKEDAELLLEKPIFSVDWEGNLWRKIQDASKIKPKDQWLVETKQLVLKAYRQQISANIEKKSIVRAKQLVLNAERYTSGPSELDDLSRLISEYEARLEMYQQKNRELVR